MMKKLEDSEFSIVGDNIDINLSGYNDISSNKYGSYIELEDDVKVGDIVTCVSNGSWVEFCRNFGDPSWAEDLSVGDNFRVGVKENGNLGAYSVIDSNIVFDLGLWYHLFCNLQTLRRLKLVKLGMRL